MKIKGVPGEYAFKALLKSGDTWNLTEEFFFTQAEATKYAGTGSLIWPVEELDNKSLYIPAQEELE